MTLINWPKIPEAGWAKKYVGKPYVAGEAGTGPTGGFDCWGLFHTALLSEFGVHTNVHSPDIAALSEGDSIKAQQRAFRAESQSWQPIRVVVAGAGVLMQRGGVLLHVGIGIGGGDILHADEGLGQVVIERVSDLKSCIHGVFLPPQISFDPVLSGQWAT